MLDGGSTMTGGIPEGIVEEAALDYFRELGYHTLP